MTIAPHPRFRASRVARVAALAVAAALVGAGCSAAGDAGPADPSVAPVPTVPAPIGPNTPFTTAPVVEPPAAPAPTGVDAVQRYVAAEAAGDWAASYALLADDDRARAGSFARWVDEAEERLPLRSLLDTTVDGSAVVTTAVLEPRLDETRVVPGRARIEWRPVAADGGWLVAPTGTRVDAVLPADDGAVTAAREWLAGRQQGETVRQYAGNLLGQPMLVDRLPAGAFTATTVEPLSAAPDPQVAVQAFGPEAERFVRVVAATGPVALVVLAAPNGDTWEVVGVQSPR